jgi:exonuclease SbcC
MKILTIRVRNLASLEGDNLIDFTTEPLKSAGIYAITGPMGAGKSTLLDALCLALFAKTPRHLNAKEMGIELQDVGNHKIGQSDIKGILRKGCGEGFAEVDFLGVDGQPYKATWSVKRAHNKIEGSLQADNVELKNITTGIIFPQKKTETLKEIERLVGLNFEQFTRSVLLAQGEFTAFLKADKDQKSSLLEKLTGTAIYSTISKRIYEKFKLEEDAFLQLKKKLDGIVLLPEQERKTLSIMRQELISDTEKMETEARFLIDAVNWHNSFAELQKGKQEAQTALRESEMLKAAASDRLVHFGLVEAAQDAKSIWEAKEENNFQWREKKRLSEELLAQISHFTDLQLIASDDLNKARSLLSTAETEAIDSKPKIEEAKKLDILIAEQNTQLAQATEEARLASDLAQNQLVKSQEKEEEKEKLLLQLKECTNWKSENESRKAVSENLPIILSKLGDAGKLLLQEKGIVAKISELQDKLEKSVATKDQFQKTEEEKKTAWQTQSQALKIDASSMETQDIDSLKILEKKIYRSKEELHSAKYCWEILFGLQQEQELIAKKTLQCFQLQDTLSVDLKTKKEAMEIARIRKEQTAKTLSQAKLQTASDVVQMRNGLVLDNPCPVCGSTIHPLVSDHAHVHQLLDLLEREDSACALAHTVLLQETASLQHQHIQVEKDLEDCTENRKRISLKIESQTKEWDTYRLSESCMNMQGAERLEWFKEEEVRLMQQAQNISAQVESYDRLKQKIQDQEKAVSLLLAELESARSSLRETLREEALVSSMLGNFNEDLSACRSSVEEITEALNPFFSSADWLNNWQRDTDQFEKKLKDFSANWKGKIQLLLEGNQRMELLQTELGSLLSQHKTFVEISTEKNNKVLHINTLLDVHKNARKQLFNGEDIMAVETKITSKINEARKQELAQQKEKDKTEKDLFKTNTQLEENEKHLLDCMKKEQGYQQQLTSWVTQYNKIHQQNLDEKKLGELLGYSSDWISDERNSLGRLQEAITTSRATLNERSRQLDSHNGKMISGSSLEELLQQQIQLKNAVEETVAKKNDIDFKMREDEANRKQWGEWEKAIITNQKNFDNWQKLQELLGAADGKKFRQIAQEYTLDILLSFTNLHLQGFAQRYAISRVPSTLALQVVDRDMGDEIRSVHSLSGGESFLVSLALALGLASLSSNKMKVESLFIDEGFGSLDLATLNIAMDALERLQDQGRKVGVISHVQEMTERISTQIIISKVSNGKSKVDVVG